MRKKTLRFIVVVAMITIILSTAAFAAFTSSDYITATSAWITREGDTVGVNFYIVGVGLMDKIGVKYVYLYESGGNNWNLVKTYSYTDLAYATTLMNTNSTMKSGYLSYAGSATKNYYAVCYFYGEKNGGSDTIPQNAY